MSDEIDRALEELRRLGEKGHPLKFEHILIKREEPPKPVEPMPRGVSQVSVVFERECDAGGPCNWVWDGEDDFCDRCYRYRNWDLKEYDEGRSAEAEEPSGTEAGDDRCDADDPGGDVPLATDTAVDQHEGTPGAGQPDALGGPDSSGDSEGGGEPGDRSSSQRAIRRATDFVKESLKESLKGSLKKMIGEQPLDRARVEEVIRSTLSTLIKEGTIESSFMVEASRHQRPGFVDLDIIALTEEAANHLLWMYEQCPGLFSRPPTWHRPPGIHVTFIIGPKENNMEKNGNTFVPGDKVSNTTTPSSKIAAQRGQGTVKGAVTDDGRMKVAWEDGTESFEKPDDLNRG